MNFGHNRITLFTLCLVVISLSPLVHSAGNQKCQIPEIDDQKEFKKFIKSRRSILALFVVSDVELYKVSTGFLCAATESMKGSADVSYVNCATKGKKLCRQLKVNPTSYELHHYDNGNFNKVYNRAETSKSLVAFLKDPTGEAPWSDDAAAHNVFHVEDQNDLQRLMTKERLPVLMMFYAPWCGHCKRLKPFFAEAANLVKGTNILAGMDVSTDETARIRDYFNISGFPTLIYFINGNPVYRYEGDQTTAAIVEWLKDPKPFEEKPKADAETPWNESETAKDVVFLTDDTFDEYVEKNPSVYVMIFAPWCGHCKRMKPDYEEAAATLKAELPEATLAAVDATISTAVATKLGVKGYPTVKYFENGVEPYTVNYRTKEQILSFMRDPKEPPVEPVEVPWDESESHVMHLNDDTFQTLAKKKKYSLVMFYAPWCGHCKKAKPEFTEAAEQLKEQSKLMMAAVDCTKFTSLCEKFGVQGYPTIKVLNYGKDPIDYLGARTSAAFSSHLLGLLGEQGKHTEL